MEAAVEGVLRVSCLPTFGRRYLVPCLAKLFQTHPGLSVEPDLTARLADQGYVVCAAPDYRGATARCKRCMPWRTHRLIDRRRSQSPLGWREVLGDDLLQHGCCVFEADDFDAQRQAAVDGIGIVRLPDWVVGHDIGRGA